MRVSRYAPDMPTIETIGFVGLGIMGASMARNLMSRGFRLRVYNRTAAKTKELADAGAIACRTPGEVAHGAQAVITIVTDAPDVEAVTFGTEGVVSGAVSGTLVIDMSTISPERTRLFAERLAAHGLRPLDAPVSGGDVGARNATLTIMVGGESADFELARPVLEAMGRRVTHLGPAGAGQVAKACNQILAAINLMGVVEALSLGSAAGLDLERLLAAVSGGAAHSWALDQLGPRIIRGDHAPGFMARLLDKDLGIVDATARTAGLALPGTALVTQLFRAMVATGHGQLGTQALALVYERMTGLQIRDIETSA